MTKLNGIFDNQETQHREWYEEGDAYYSNRLEFRNYTWGAFIDLPRPESDDVVLFDVKLAADETLEPFGHTVAFDRKCIGVRLTLWPTPRQLLNPEYAIALGHSLINAGHMALGYLPGEEEV